MTSTDTLRRIAKNVIHGSLGDASKVLMFMDDKRLYMAKLDISAMFNSLIQLFITFFMQAAKDLEDS